MVSSTCFDFQLKSPASATPGSFRHPVQVFQGCLGSTHGTRAGAGAAPGGTPGGEVGIPGRSWAICTLMAVHELKSLAFPMFHGGFNRAWYVYINGICYVAKLVYSWFFPMVTMACDAYGNYIYIEWGLPFGSVWLSESISSSNWKRASECKLAMASMAKSMSTCWGSVEEAPPTRTTRAIMAIRARANPCAESDLGRDFWKSGRAIGGQYAFF